MVTVSLFELGTCDAGAPAPTHNQARQRSVRLELLSDQSFAELRMVLVSVQDEIESTPLKCPLD